MTTRAYQQEAGVNDRCEPHAGKKLLLVAAVAGRCGYTPFYLRINWSFSLTNRAIS
jgi:glutathione peroxidase-family protein